MPKLPGNFRRGQSPKVLLMGQKEVRGKNNVSTKIKYEIKILSKIRSAIINCENLNKLELPTNFLKTLPNKLSLYFPVLFNNDHKL